MQRCDTGCSHFPEQRFARGCGLEGESKGKQESKDSDFIRRRTLEALFHELPEAAGQAPKHSTARPQQHSLIKHCLLGKEDESASLARMLCCYLLGKEALPACCAVSGA